MLQFTYIPNHKIIFHSQDIGTLTESVDRNFEELQRLAFMINSSLSLNTQLPNPEPTPPSESEEEKSTELPETHLETEVRRLKRAFKDQKMFFHSWKEDLGSKIKTLHQRIDEQTNEVTEKVSNTSDNVNLLVSLTTGIADDVALVKQILDSIADNVTDITDRELTNTNKLNDLTKILENFNKSFVSSLKSIGNDIKMSGVGNDAQFTAVRLAGGSTDFGRLEVFVDGEWGTVCDDEFGSNEANVACKMLGFGRSTSVRTNAYYGQGSGPILFDNVQCSGDENSLFSCQIDYDTSDCAHAEDVGVVCE